LRKTDTAVVLVYPQNNVLSDKDLAWGAVGDSFKEDNTIEKMERIFKGREEERLRGLHLPYYF
jgi:hypothetical protein